MRRKTKVIVHIDMDAFFAAIEQRDNPALRGQPVIVGADPKQGKGRGVVSTCSYEARQYGIHSAMPISTAYRICPHGIFLSVDMRKYHKVSDQMFNVLYDFTPDIELISIDEAFLDMTGSYHLFGSPREACLEIKKRIKEQLHLTASIGIAPSKMAAKIASDLSKPDGLMEVRPEDIQAFLWVLPIEKLWGVGQQTQKTLNAMGVKTVGDLAKMPLEALRQRWGEKGQHLFELSHGIDERNVRTDDLTKSVSHEHTFETDTADRDQIDDILSVLSEKVSRRLRRDGLKGKTLTVKVRFSNFRTITRNCTLAERTNFFDVIYKKSKALFDAIYDPRQRYRLIGVRLSDFIDPYVQDSLFKDPLLVKKEQIHQAVDIIKDKFGEGMITRALGSSLTSGRKFNSAV